MGEYTHCLATTGCVRKGFTEIRFTEDSLSDQVKQINEIAHIPCVTLDHNPLLMPIGRSDGAWIEKGENAVYLMAKILLDLDAEAQEHVQSGRKIVRLEFGKSTMGFSAHSEDWNTTELKIEIDPFDFDSLESEQMFVQEVTGSNDAVRVERYARHSEECIGLIRIILSEPGALGLAGTIGSLAVWTGVRLERFFRYTVDETLRKVGDGISDKWSESILKVLKIYERRKSQTTKKYIWTVTIPGKPDLVLVREQEVGENGGEGQVLDLEEIQEELMHYDDLLPNAQEITLVKVTSGKWRFQHIKTESGDVVADWTSYQEARTRWNQMAENLK